MGSSGGDGGAQGHARRMQTWLPTHPFCPMTQNPRNIRSAPALTSFSSTSNKVVSS